MAQEYLKIAAVIGFAAIAVAFVAYAVLYVQSDEYQQLQQQREADALVRGKHTPVPSELMPTPTVTGSVPWWDVTPTPTTTATPPTSAWPFPSASPMVRPRSPDRNRSA